MGNSKDLTREEVGWFARKRLAEIRTSRIKWVRVLGCNDPSRECDSYRAVKGELFEVEFAPELPLPGCDLETCHCILIAEKGPKENQQKQTKETKMKTQVESQWEASEARRATASMVQKARVIEARCPVCRQWTEMESDLLGTDVTCPNCKQPVKMVPRPNLGQTRRRIWMVVIVLGGLALFVALYGLRVKVLNDTLSPRELPDIRR